jgi:hypothetical protein
VAEDELDFHVDRALAALEDVPVRELENTERALWRRRSDGDGLFRFAGTFGAVAFDKRTGDRNDRYARIQLSSAIMLAGPSLAERLEDTEEPFWQAVRDGLLAYREAEFGEEKVG